MIGPRPFAVRCLGALAALLPGGCGWTSDPATRLDAELSAAAGRLDRAEGARLTYRSTAPGGCPGAARVQLEPDGPLVVWCEDASGKTVADGLTTHQNQAFATAESFTRLVPPGQPLTVTFERRGTRAVLVALD